MAESGVGDDRAIRRAWRRVGNVVDAGCEAHGILAARRGPIFGWPASRPGPIRPVSGPPAELFEFSVVAMNATGRFTQWQVASMRTHPCPGVPNSRMASLPGRSEEPQQAGQPSPAPPAAARAPATGQARRLGMVVREADEGHLRALERARLGAQAYGLAGVADVSAVRPISSLDGPDRPRGEDLRQAVWVQQVSTRAAMGVFGPLARANADHARRLLAG